LTGNLRGEAMIDSRTILAVIPARGGSKTLPRKNIIPVMGKPLLAWTVEAARRSRYIDRLVLSSDDDEIIGVAHSLGLEVPFRRPSELAADTTSTNDVLFHLLSKIAGYDYLVVLQVTSPLRTAEDIDGCIGECVYKEAGACVTVSLAEKNPYYFRTIDSKGRLKPLIGNDYHIGRRQDLPDVYMINGAVFASQTAFFLEKRTFFTPETVSYVMPQGRSIDIDSEKDLAVMEYLLSKRNLAN
jgi:CMP-N,N'-diacetyllegionaminic acid synthase